MSLREDMRLMVVPGAVEGKTEVTRLNLKNGPSQRSPSFDAAQIRI